MHGDCVCWPTRRSAANASKRADDYAQHFQVRLRPNRFVGRVGGLEEPGTSVVSAEVLQLQARQSVLVLYASTDGGQSGTTEHLTGLARPAQQVTKLAAGGSYPQPVGPCAVKGGRSSPGRPGSSSLVRH